MASELALLAHWSVRQKLNRISSVQISYVALHAPLRFCRAREVSSVSLVERALT